MLIFFLGGVCILFIIISISLIIQNLSIFTTVTGTIGIICIVISALFSGTLISGDRIRANYSDEQSNSMRTSWSLKILLLGLPCLLGLVVTYLIVK